MTDDEREERLKPKLTPEFLETLAESVESIGWSLDAIETQKLYENCCRIAGVEPRDLDFESE